MTCSHAGMIQYETTTNFRKCKRGIDSGACLCWPYLTTAEVERDVLHTDVTCQAEQESSKTRILYAVKKQSQLKIKDTERLKF